MIAQRECRSLHDRRLDLRYDDDRARLSFLHERDRAGRSRCNGQTTQDDDNGASVLLMNYFPGRCLDVNPSLCDSLDDEGRQSLVVQTASPAREAADVELCRRAARTTGLSDERTVTPDLDSIRPLLPRRFSRRPLGTGCAVITHGHADHRPRLGTISLPPGPAKRSCRRRLGDITLQTLDYAESLQIGDVRSVPASGRPHSRFRANSARSRRAHRRRVGGLQDKPAMRRALRSSRSAVTRS